MRYVLFYAAHKCASYNMRCGQQQYMRLKYALCAVLCGAYFSSKLSKNIYLMYIFIANKFIEIYAGFMRLCGICEICGKSHNRIKPASLNSSVHSPWTLPKTWKSAVTNFLAVAIYMCLDFKLNLFKFMTLFKKLKNRNYGSDRK